MDRKEDYRRRRKVYIRKGQKGTHKKIIGKTKEDINNEARKQTR